MTGWLPQTIRFGAGSLLGALVLVSASLAAAAQRIPDDLAARLNDRQLKAYQAYLTARTPFERRLDVYWAEVDSLRDGRRRKRAAGMAFTAADYVPEHPPQYEGPPLPSDVAKIIAELRPPRPDKQIAGLHDFLAAAKSQYGYVPSAIAEREFKRRFRSACPGRDVVVHAGCGYAKHPHLCVHGQDLRAAHVCDVPLDRAVKLPVSRMWLGNPFSHACRDGAHVDPAFRHLHRVRADAVATFVRRLAVHRDVGDGNRKPRPKPDRVLVW